MKISVLQEPISDRFRLLCPRVFYPAAAILENERTLGTRLHTHQNSQSLVFTMEADYVMSDQEEPQCLVGTLEKDDYEMDEVFAEDEPMDICDGAPMEERQVLTKNEKEYTVNQKTKEEEITVVWKGNEEQYTVVIKKSKH